MLFLSTILLLVAASICNRFFSKEIVVSAAILLLLVWIVLPIANIAEKNWNKQRAAVSRPFFMRGKIFTTEYQFGILMSKGDSA